jgi:hypothetical protein
MEESELENLFVFTLRVELSNGKVLVYAIDRENKDYLFNKLSTNSDGYNESNYLRFLWFETSLERNVIISTSAVVSISFLVDIPGEMENHMAYRDNFNVVEKETFIEEIETAEGETRSYVINEEYLPQAIIYHKGQAAEDNYNKNPLLYSLLSPGCLGLFYLELDGLLPFRQFINLTDQDEEESFIPLEQIMVMEFNSNLIYESEQEE